MSGFKEAIEDRIGPVPNYIDTTEILLQYYGPNSLACHGLRQVDDTHWEAFFIVPPNLCGPQARPPMFDRLAYVDGNFHTRTGRGDAKEHFIESVVVDGTHIEVIPGHNIAGLKVAAAELAYNQGREEPEDLMLASFNHIRYKGFVLPDQDLVLVGGLQKGEGEIVYSPKAMANNLTRAETNGLKLVTVDHISGEERAEMLLQHWLLETTAQGFGVTVARAKQIRGLLPVLMQSERSRFGRNLIRKGDLISTLFELLPSPAEQGFGNASISVNGVGYGDQRRLMVRFYPLPKIAEGIEVARG